jgi:hypothetical protein
MSQNGLETTAGSRETRPLLGVAIFLVVVGLLWVPTAAGDSTVGADTGIAFAIVLVAAIGGFLVARRPNHPISWLMAAAALTGGLAGLSAQAIPPGTTEMSLRRTMLAVISGPTWFLLLGLILVAIPILFPTGLPPTPKWRWVLWAALVNWAAMSLLFIFQERFCTAWEDGCLSYVPNPIGIDGVVNPEESALGGLLYGTLVIASLAAMASLVVRYRRSIGAERLQIKWVLLSIGLFSLVTIAIDVVWIDILGRPEPAGIFLWVDQIIWVMIPASIAVAILRYRLYEIDRIISRTLTYAVVVGLLAVVVLGLIASMTLFLPSDDPLAVAVATLAVFVLFNPVRHRVQRWVDRRFNRSRYDSARVIDQFSASLQDRVDIEGIVDDWVDLVEETMQPTSVGVWVRY